jgi:hypothetical protein
VQRVSKSYTAFGFPSSHACTAPGRQQIFLRCVHAACECHWVCSKSDGPTSIAKMTAQASRLAAKVPNGNQAAAPGAAKFRSASNHRNSAPGGPDSKRTQNLGWHVPLRFRASWRMRLHAD